MGEHGLVLELLNILPNDRNGRVLILHDKLHSTQHGHLCREYTPASPPIHHHPKSNADLLSYNLQHVIHLHIVVIIQTRFTIELHKNQPISLRALFHEEDWAVRHNSRNAYQSNRKHLGVHDNSNNVKRETAVSTFQNETNTSLVQALREEYKREWKDHHQQTKGEDKQVRVRIRPTLFQPTHHDIDLVVLTLFQQILSIRR